MDYFEIEKDIEEFLNNVTSMEPYNTISMKWKGEILKLMKVDISIEEKMSKLNWDKINYVINHKNGAKWDTVQAVIWHYLGEAPPYTGGSIDGYDTGKYQELIDNADLHGVGYSPYCREKYAIILYQSGLQAIFAEVSVPTVDCTNPPPIPTPEFPTIALPAGMLVSLVGLIYLVRGREN